MSTFEEFTTSDEIIYFFGICWLVTAFVVTIYTDRERREQHKKLKQKIEKLKEEKLKEELEQEKLKEEELKLEIQKLELDILKLDQKVTSRIFINDKISNKNTSLSHNNTYYNFTKDFNKSRIIFHD